MSIGARTLLMQWCITLFDIGIYAKLLKLYLLQISFIG
jgi:hypothetical protein